MISNIPKWILGYSLFHYSLNDRVKSQCIPETVQYLKHRLITIYDKNHNPVQQGVLIDSEGNFITIIDNHNDINQYNQQYLKIWDDQNQIHKFKWNTIIEADGVAIGNINNQSGLDYVQTEGQSRIGEKVLMMGRKTDQHTFIQKAIKTDQNIAFQNRLNDLINIEVKDPILKGSPILNSNNHLIGLLRPQLDGPASIIPNRILKGIIDQYLEHQQVQRSYLGISVKQKSIQEYNKQTDGIMIVNVDSDSIAKKSGLMMGDLIIDINDIRTDNIHSFFGAIGYGEKIYYLSINRKGQQFKVLVEL